MDGILLDGFNYLYDELVKEFYSTFWFEKPNVLTPSSPVVIYFWLMARVFDLSITQFNLVLGFYTDEYVQTSEYLQSLCDFPADFDPQSVFIEWSIGEPYDPSSSKDLGLKNPALKYIHRFLALTFSSRQHSSNTLNKTELFFCGVWFITGRLT